MAQSAITEDTLRAALVERLQATHVEIQDMSGGCGQAFTSLIISPQFTGKTSLKRHRLVNTALRDEIAQIHAWSARCQTPEEYARDKQKEESSSEGVEGPPLDGTEGGRVEGTTA
ncbi:bola protein [Dichotomopilus funicola]|uniref:Bola protein n=1 Tax=Dichotomopilus funicola TaxID=1934379 RepID=A0AAN6V1G7_9PEZI|nr:bola protein [Dichotomopilus funicola]